MRPRQVYVIEWRNKQIWETWEIHGCGGRRSEGGGLKFYRYRLRCCKKQWPEHKFRLVRYVPEKA